MPYGFARKEISDAKERVQEGNYDAAALFVRNAKADIEDYAEIDHGLNKEEFDKCHDLIQEEVEKSSPSEGQVMHVLTRMEKFMDKMDRVRRRKEDQTADPNRQ